MNLKYLRTMLSKDGKTRLIAIGDSLAEKAFLKIITPLNNKTPVICYQVEGFSVLETHTLQIVPEIGHKLRDSHDEELLQPP